MGVIGQEGLEIDLIERFPNNSHRYFGYWDNSDAWTGNQMKVTSKKETVDIIKSQDGINNCGISISAIKHGVPLLLFLPFDFDSKSIESAFQDAKKLFNFFAKSKYKASLHFSGKKGFHVLISTVPKIYTKRQLRYIQTTFKNMFNLQTCDDQIFGDVRRLIRIPGTEHIDGELCRVIAKSNGELLNLNDIMPDKKIPKDFTIPDTPDGEVTVKHRYYCIEKLIKDKDYWMKRDGSYEPDQLVRFSWAIEQLAKDKSIDEIVKKAEEFGWDDFNPEIVRYQLSHIKGLEYIHPSCETLMKAGYCMKDCPLNKWCV